MKNTVLSSILLLLSSILVYGFEEHTANRSINIVMDLDIDTKSYEERRGDFVHEVRLYTIEERTIIMWIDNEDYYLYTLQDNNHQERGFNLFHAITRGDLLSYISEKTPQKRKRFSKYYRVIGLQIGDLVSEQ